MIFAKHMVEILEGLPPSHGEDRGKKDYRLGSLRNSMTSLVDHLLYQRTVGTRNVSAVKWSSKNKTLVSKMHLDSIIINRINTLDAQPNPKQKEDESFTPSTHIMLTRRPIVGSTAISVRSSKNL